MITLKPLTEPMRNLFDLYNSYHDVQLDCGLLQGTLCIKTFRRNLKLSKIQITLQMKLLIPSFLNVNANTDTYYPDLVEVHSSSGFSKIKITWLGQILFFHHFLLTSSKSSLTFYIPRYNWIPNSSRAPHRTQVKFSNL